MASAMITINQLANGKNKKSEERSRFVVRCGLVFACVFAPLACAEGSLQDPTRPPAELSAPQGNTGAPVTSGPQLQSVLISAHQRSAIISGQRVKVGEKLGDARVVMISENEVILKGGSGLQTLKLFPDVGKRLIMRSQHHKH